MHTEMHSSNAAQQAPDKAPSTVALFKPNEFGIKGMDGIVSEWGIKTMDYSNKKENREYVILGGLYNGVTEDSVTLIQPIQRHPWEGFAKVGFRCVLSVRQGGGESIIK